MTDLRVIIQPTGHGYTVRLWADEEVIHRRAGIPTLEEARRRAQALSLLYHGIPVRVVR